MTTPILDAKDVAEYFLANVEEDEGDNISNLKLQKLLYYAQGYHLAIFGIPLFKEEIRAWTHGPVVTALYHAYKQYGSNAIPVPNNIDFSQISPDVRDLLDEVQKIYGQYSAWKLRDMTHAEPPWKDASTDSVISHNSMRDFFRTLLIDGQQ